MSKKKNLIDVISTIQRELKVPKNRRNDFGKYNYRSAEDIVDAVKKALPEGFYLTMTDDVAVKGDRHYVVSRAALCCLGGSNEGSDGPSIQSISATGWAREADAEKGKGAAQITGAASSYARKYALNGLFAIDDGIDPDSEEPQKGGNGNGKPPRVAQSKSGKITEAQRKRLFAISNNTGLSPAEVKDLIKQMTGAESSKDLDKKGYDAVCETLQRMSK